MNIEQALGNILEWASNHIIFVVIFFTFVVQITPIKWNPWTSLATWFGKKITEGACLKLDGITTRVEKIEKEVMENEKDRIREEVLDFANSCRNGRKHTENEFKHIVTLNKKYQKLLKATGDENGVFELEYEYIKKLYARRLEKNDFLTSYGGHDPEEEEVVTNEQ